MIGLYIAPAYILLNILFLVMFLRWLGNTIPPFKSWIVRIPFILVFMAGTLSMGVAFLLPPGFIQKWLRYIGNIWIGGNVMTLMILCPIAIIRWIIMIDKRLKGKKFKEQRQKFRTTIRYKLLGLLIVAGIVGSTGYGVYHGQDIVYNNYEVDIDKDGGKIKSLNAVMIGDIHMGYNVGVEHVQQMVDKINALDADIILIAGDIFDNEYEAMDDPEKLIEILKTMKAKYGVYSVYGNHDIQEKILAGFTFDQNGVKEADERMDAFIEACGWKHLRDEVALVDNSFYIIGRADEERPGKGIEERATIEELLEETDMEKPLFVLDHEPKELKIQATAGVDLCLNGHVHDGQVFPGNILMKILWDNSCGYKKFGYMHSIVTSGVGIWGPPLRIGTDSEICQIKVNFVGPKEK